MDKRLKLQETLEDILGSKRVYFQSPKNVRLSYPCIIYKLITIGKKNADDGLYLKDPSYSITLIHTDPDNDIKEKLLQLPMCCMNSYFISDNLHHYVYTIHI